MYRSYGVRTLAVTNTAQPVVGTTLTAAVLANTPAPQLLAVADSSIFDQGHWALVDVGAALEERVLVLSIPDATHINVQGEQQGVGCVKAHAINAIVRPSRLINSLYVQPQDGTSNPMFICTGPAGKTDGTLCLKKIINVTGSQPPDFTAQFTTGGGPNSMDLAEFWIVGTVGAVNTNSYLAAAGII